MKLIISVFAAFLVGVASAEEQHHEGWRKESADPILFTARRVAVDNATKAAVATGEVHAVSGVFKVTSDYMERDADGVYTFKAPTCVTTCTNEVGHTHWGFSGGVEYQADNYVILKDAWLTFFEFPILYIPYIKYPLDTGYGVTWVPGYTGRWGAFMLSKVSYDIAGDPHHHNDTWWIRGGTRFDLRYKNGAAVGEDLDWNCGEFGRGGFNIYHAWDADASDRYTPGDMRDENWSSSVPNRRYGMSFKHRWDVTERDVVMVRASHFSDSQFRDDFMRKSFFEIRQQWSVYRNSGVFWDHLENSFSLGAEYSGRLNHFYTMTERLPEFYFDVNPQPVFDLPINYESSSRAGWLDRRYARYAAGAESILGSMPGLWCDYDTFRFDTYHRLTAPIRVADDVLSIVPRLGYHGTYWHNSGISDYYGRNPAEEKGALFRSIAEAGTTFAARGTGWVNDFWAHTIEPYVDVLAQKAWYAGNDGDNRPYVFDNIDESMTWEDQYAGRSRNLPYTYCGITPGLRNVWSRLIEDGNTRAVVDFDFYAAFSFDKTSYEGDSTYGSFDSHKLSPKDRMNYGDHGVSVAPGFRLRWSPEDDVFLMMRAEYDSDNNTLALGDIAFKQKLSKTFSYTASYGLRRHRYWDFSSRPYSPYQLRDDSLNIARFHYARLGCEYQPIDWLALGPFVRWDIDDNELDCAGAWIDLLTDCLGFRFILEYENSYQRIDRYEHGSDWSVGFYIYLRAFGANGIFMDN